MEPLVQLSKKLRFFDIAANLSDQQFKGFYYDQKKQSHPCDVDSVIARAASIGCDRLLIVGGYLVDSQESYEICKKSGKFYTTVGVHPCRVDEVEKGGSDQAKYFSLLHDLIEKQRDKCVAVGECGLDYDRFDYTPKELQLKHFPPHFDLAQHYNLPMYLHNRNTGDDFFELVRANRHKFPAGGVVHSFTGSQEELQKILSLDLYVGINGCSLKSKESLDIVKQIPLERLMIETDSPYCEIRNTHESAQFVKTKFTQIKKEKWAADKMVRGRNEPCNVKQVAEVLAAVLQKPEEEIAEIAYQNALKLFRIQDIESGGFVPQSNKKEEKDEKLKESGEEKKAD